MELYTHLSPPLSTKGDERNSILLGCRAWTGNYSKHQGCSPSLNSNPHRAVHNSKNAGQFTNLVYSSSSCRARAGICRKDSLRKHHKMRQGRQRPGTPRSYLLTEVRCTSSLLASRFLVFSSHQLALSLLCPGCLWGKAKDRTREREARRDICLKAGAQQAAPEGHPVQSNPEPCQESQGHRHQGAASG